MEKIQSVRENSFGNLFHHDVYGKDTKLLRHAIYEIAEHLGHTIENPLFMGVLCLQFDIPHEISWWISVDLRAIIDGRDPTELKTLDQFREIMAKRFPPAKKMSDVHIRAFIKAISKFWLSEPEFQPYAKALCEDKP
ncbi:MAG: hypothetical protein FWG65_05150 [Turicibacter sp.]|nr:hypothetical protein [Turicibacter sp.]